MEKGSTKRSVRHLGADTRVLTADWYESRDTLTAARELLGKILIVRPGGAGAPAAARIVETEAYHGDDPASHCRKGWTPRCAPMFERGGIAYVYFVYGMYEMLNFVTEREGYPGAVLIRGLEPLDPSVEPTAYAGPGRLTRALGIDRKLNRASLQGPALSVHDDGFSHERVVATPRVGIREGRSRLWRFCADGSPGVSLNPLNQRRKRIR